MNKLMGFYELAAIDIPSIPWKEYTGKECLDQDCLWTIRSAVFHGDDLNLPREVGATALKAKEFANTLLKKMKDKGIVIYYPYFLANKSGTLNIYGDKVVIEAVASDLWNLVTYSDREITIQIIEDEVFIDGKHDFFSEDEYRNLTSNVATIRKIFRDDLLEGKSVLLEWSFAQKSDLSKKPIGEEYLVFYEARTVN